MAYYCNEIFSNHVGEEEAVKQAAFFSAVLTMILMAQCHVTCTFTVTCTRECHTHSDFDPSASVYAQMLSRCYENFSSSRRPRQCIGIEATKLPAYSVVVTCSVFMCVNGNLSAKS